MAVLVREKAFYANLFRLAVPIILQALISYGVNFADNLMVGTLGEYAIGGVYLGSQVQVFLTMIVGGIEGTILVLSAQYWGRKDLDSIRRIIAIGARVSLLCGAVFFLASCFATESILRLFTQDERVILEGARYLRIISVSFLFFSVSHVLIASMRSVEKVRVGLCMSILSFFSNLALNYIFIFGKLGVSPMGAAGAALATLLSRLLEMVCMVVYVFLIEKRLALKPRDMLARSSLLLRDMARYGLPILGGQLVWSVNLMCQSAIVGRISPAAIAAVSISNMLYSLIYVGANGLASAVGIVTGKTVGAGEFDLMKLYARTIQLLMLGMGILSGLCIFLLKGPFLSLYNLEPETIHLADQFLTVLSVTIIGSNYQAACLAGLVKAGGDTGFMFKNDFIFVFFVVLPLASLAQFVLGAPPWVVFFCLKIDQILKCFVAVVKINRFKWMKNLTRDFAVAEA